jgi:integrase
MAQKIGIKQVLAMGPHTILWDSAVKGFNARRQIGDAMTFSVFYRTLDGQQRWHRIGRFGVWTPEQARKEAQRVLRARDLGEDPSGSRMAVRQSPTMAELLDEYVADMDAHRINGKKASTIYTDKNRITKHIAPRLGKFKVASVTQSQIEDFMNDLSPGSARRIMNLTGAIFTYALKKKLRVDNPCRGIEMPKGNKKLRRLSIAEYAQLGRALNGDNVAGDIFLLLTVSGWRSGEARLLKYSELDLDRRIANLGDTKSDLSVRPLSNAAIEIIQKQPRAGEYVFGQPIKTLSRQWDRLGMAKDVTPHTLRHSFASLAADMQMPDSIIAGLLGHKLGSITSRYTHLSNPALIEAADKVADATLRLMQINLDYR